MFCPVHTTQPIDIANGGTIVTNEMKIKAGPDRADANKT